MAENPNVVHEEQLTVGQRFADKLAAFGGSWPFIGLFFVLLSVWMVLNTTAPIKHWDVYPFILLNLVLSCLAAIQAPVILMSQNRQADRDRVKTDLDYETDVMAEEYVEHLQQELAEIKKMLSTLCERSSGSAT